MPFKLSDIGEGIAEVTIKEWQEYTLIFFQLCTNLVMSFFGVVALCNVLLSEFNKFNDFTNGLSPMYHIDVNT